MSRLFKFRAWPKRIIHGHKKKRMYYRILHEDYWFNKPSDDGEDINWNNAVISVRGSDPYNLDTMEYTGLQDSKGVDIYESDILAFGTGLEMQRGVVIYHNGGFCFDLNPPFFVIRRAVAAVIRRPSADARIIGNIYENPELLEK